MEHLIFSTRLSYEFGLIHTEPLRVGYTILKDSLIIPGRLFLLLSIDIYIYRS